MIGIKSTFNKSFYYSLKVREDDSYVEKYLKIAQSLQYKKHINFKFKPTGLWSKDELVSYKNDLKNKKSDSYRFFPLNVKYKINFKKQATHRFIMLGFSNKYQLKSFLKDFHINKNQIAYCFWNHENIYEDVEIFGIEKVADSGKYKIVFKLMNPTNSSISSFKRQLTAYNNKFSTSSYGKIEIYDYLQLPSSIHDRWFDPFKMQKIYNFDEVYKHYLTSKELYLGNILHQTQLKTKLYEKNNTKSVSTFISNKDLYKNKLELEIFSTRFYREYLEDKNPYKIAKFRKDWKFAAEALIKEIYGKYLYKSTLKIDKNDLCYYNSQRDLINDCYFFKDLNKEVPIETQKIQNKIKFVEKKIECVKKNIEVIHKFIEEREKEIENSYNPTETKRASEESILEDYNKLDDLWKKLYPTFRSYLNYRRNQELDENNIFDVFREDEILNFWTEKIKQARKEVEKLNQVIKLKKNSIDFYNNSDYAHKYNKIHNEFNELQNTLYGLVFSKKELTLFVNSLNIKTKICPCKFRKIILDVLTDVKILFSNNKSRYDRFKCICRRYIFDINIWNSIVKKMVSVITSKMLVINKLENYIDEFHLHLSNFPLQFAPCVEYADPPD